MKRAAKPRQTGIATRTSLSCSGDEFNLAANFVITSYFLAELRSGDLLQGITMIVIALKEAKANNFS